MTAPTRIFISRDMASVSLGADRIAAALTRLAAERGLSIDIVRTGSRGLVWLEPLVEVETAQGRIAYGPLKMGDLAGLLDAGALEGGAHALRLGKLEDLPWLARKQRLTFARCGIIDPLSLADYRAHGGMAGLAIDGNGMQLPDPPAHHRYPQQLALQHPNLPRKDDRHGNRFPGR